MTGPAEITPSELLEGLLAFSAGLCRRRPRAAVRAAYPALHDHLRRRKVFRRSFLAGPDRIAIEGFDALPDRLAQLRPTDVVLASSYYGNPVVHLCGCARRGLPCALAYQSLAPTSVEALTSSGVRLLPLEGFDGPRDLFATLDQVRREGRYFTVLIDVPRPSRHCRALLGYAVAVSALAATYARRTGSALVPVWARVTGEDRLDQTLGSTIETPGAETTQDLLDGLEAMIERDSVQYAWSSVCPIYADPAAKANALSFLPDVLAWRDALPNPAERPAVRRRTRSCRRPPW